jgi:hypothetical protein
VGVGVAELTVPEKFVHDKIIDRKPVTGKRGHCARPGSVPDNNSSGRLHAVCIPGAVRRRGFANPVTFVYLAGGVELDSPGFFELPAFFFAASASAAFFAAAASCFLRIISASLQNRKITRVNIGTIQRMMRVSGTKGLDQVFVAGMQPAEMLFLAACA